MGKFKDWVKRTTFRPKLLEYIKWLYIDIFRAIRAGKTFREYGCTFYVGIQGAGKTMALVEYLERMRRKYPKAIIVTNFDYVHQLRPMQGWRDLLELRNGTDGVIFAIDEIQNEYSTTDWKDFPESLLSEVTQQRKQRVKIACTSQVFTRVVKQLREQALEVVECRTLGGRWTFTRAFSGEDYNDAIDKSSEGKRKVPRLWRKNFVQSDALRACYDSYAKIERMAGREFLDRKDRVV